MSPLRRWRTVDPLAGSLDPVYPPPAPQQPTPEARPVGTGEHEPPPSGDERRRSRRADRAGRDDSSPSLTRRFGSGLSDLRRRVLPLPDEVIDEFLGHGEQVIHSDHPSFRSFMVENTLLFLGLLVVGVLFLGITFNGSATAAAALLLGLAVVLLVLVFKRIGDRYTSYVVTDTRIMQIQGVLGRKAHSIPWVRVTDLTIDQSLMGRLFGYATLHIESANEDSGLRDLDGVSDPMQFNQFVVDMVVAKQGTTQPAWVAAGEPGPPSVGRGLRRVRTSRRRHGDADDASTRPSTAAQSQPPSDGPRPQGERAVRRPPASTPTPGGGVAADRPYDVEAEIEELAAETLAARLRASSEPGLRWADDDDRP